MPVDGYLRSVLTGATRPVRHRGGVRDLLGLPEAGASISFTGTPRAAGFVYRHTGAAAPQPESSWQIQVIDDFGYAESTPPRPTPERPGDVKTHPARPTTATPAPSSWLDAEAVPAAPRPVHQVPGRHGPGGGEPAVVVRVPGTTPPHRSPATPQDRDGAGPIPPARGAVGTRSADRGDDRPPDPVHSRSEPAVTSTRDKEVAPRDRRQRGGDAPPHPPAERPAALPDRQGDRSANPPVAAAGPAAPPDRRNGSASASRADSRRPRDGSPSELLPAQPPRGKGQRREGRLEQSRLGDDHVRQSPAGKALRPGREAPPAPARPAPSATARLPVPQRDAATTGSGTPANDPAGGHLHATATTPPPPQPPPVVLFTPRSSPPAFWERRHIGRLRSRITR